MDRVRIGTLGAARITPMALVRPAAKLADAEVVAVAARDRTRAERFARKHGIPTVHDSYEDVVGDPDVDAVYIPLPNNLHARWALAALAAGKHVLVEKPFASNAREAEEVAAAASGTDRVVMEAFHYRFHPLVARLVEILGSGVLGEVRHVETWMCLPLPMLRDIRYQYDLAGGAVMDTGVYTIHLLRTLAGAEPTVTAARARLLRPQVDRWLQADLSLPGGATGRITCALLSSSVLRIGARVVGERGELRVFNPIGPQYVHRIALRVDGRRAVERVTRRPTYDCQLEAFTAAVLHGGPVLTPPADSVATMRVVDAVYEAAGLNVRGT